MKSTKGPDLRVVAGNAGEVGRVYKHVLLAVPKNPTDFFKCGKSMMVFATFPAFGDMDPPAGFEKDLQAKFGDKLTMRMPTTKSTTLFAEMPFTVQPKNNGIELERLLQKHGYTVTVYHYSLKECEAVTPQPFRRATK